MNGTDFSERRQELLIRLLQEEGISASQMVSPQERSANIPLSFAQHRLWFLDQLYPGDPFYNISISLLVDGPLNTAALQQSIDEIVRRHDNLRTTFVSIDGEPTQTVASSLNLSLTLVDLRRVPDGQREEWARRLAGEYSRGVFDLATGPLMRVALVRLSAQQHALLLVIHHIIFDGWSAGVLCSEIASLYGAFSVGAQSPLPDLPLQYADFAIWQRRWLQGEVLEEQLSYWTKQMAGALPLLELPGDRPRPALQSLRGATESINLSKQLSDAVKSLGNRESVTLFMTILAAFKTLVYRYTGQKDIVIGSVIANRNRREIEGLIGFFINSIVLRTQLSGELTFRQLLGQIRKVTLEAYNHQDLPFEKLVEVLQPQRNLGYPPVYQLGFAFQNTPIESFESPGLKLRPLSTGKMTEETDFNLTMYDSDDGLVAIACYSTDLFNPETVARMMREFETLIESIVANPDRRLSDLCLLDDQARRQLLVEWNDTKAAYPVDKCVHDLFEAQVAHSPDGVAAVIQDQYLTYAELNRQANRLGGFLKKSGLEPDTLVGLYLERSLEMVVALLGILKAGAAYLPLDPGYPKQRLGFMLRDAGVRILLTKQRHLADLPECGAVIIALDSDGRSIAQESGENPVAQVANDNLAYAIYTSGSTGTPNGVLITHENLVSYADGIVKAFDLRPDDHVLQFTQLSFDVSVEELFPTWLSGASVVLRPDSIAPSFAELRGLIESHQLTVLNLPTAYWEEWVEDLSKSKSRPPSSVRLVIVGGQRISRKALEAWSESGIPTINAYGLTETTVTSTIYPVPPITEITSELAIGRPTPNTLAYILDSNLQPVPVGVTGEIYIGGAHLARGYLNRPDLTAGRFSPNPFTDEPGSRLYKTNDMARWRADANIYFGGRSDNQMKIRGYRIEPGDVEAALKEHASVQEAVAIACPESEKRSELIFSQTGNSIVETNNLRLEAYIVFKQDRPVSASQLRAFLKRRLPDYMVPESIAILDAFPLTPNGKIDRKLLSISAPRRESEDERYLAPRTDLEEEMATMWAEILRVQRVGIEDDFFNLGGHSLLATRFIARVRDHFGVDLPLRTLFQTPTIAGLAVAIVQLQAEQIDSAEIDTILASLG